MINGFLALTMLSPRGANSGTFRGNGTPALSITRASLGVYGSEIQAEAGAKGVCESANMSKVFCA